MIAMLLLAAAGAGPGQIVDDYMETVRLGDLRASTVNRNNDEAEIGAFCRTLGTTTEGAFRAAVAGLGLAGVLTAAGLSRDDRMALAAWRGTLPHEPPASP